MPLGDSITYGQGSSDGGGYRVPLFRRACSDGKALTFVGSVEDGPAQVDGRAFPAQHEGFPGITIGGGVLPGLMVLAAHALRMHEPEIALLMIGTNDMNLGFEAATAPRRLGALLDSMTSALPELRVLVAQLPPSADERLDARIRSFNAALAVVVEARRAAGQRLQVVDMYSALTAAPDWRVRHLCDDVHPSDAGYAAIADAWYAQLAPHVR